MDDASAQAAGLAAASNALRLGVEHGRVVPEKFHPSTAFQELSLPASEKLVAVAASDYWLAAASAVGVVYLRPCAAAALGHTPQWSALPPVPKAADAGSSPCPPAIHVFDLLSPTTGTPGCLVSFLWKFRIHSFAYHSGDADADPQWREFGTGDTDDALRVLRFHVGVEENAAMYAVVAEEAELPPLVESDNAQPPSATEEMAGVTLDPTAPVPEPPPSLLPSGPTQLLAVVRMDIARNERQVRKAWHPRPTTRTLKLRCVDAKAVVALVDDGSLAAWNLASEPETLAFPVGEKNGGESRSIVDFDVGPDGFCVAVDEQNCVWEWPAHRNNPSLTAWRAPPTAVVKQILRTVEVTILRLQSGEVLGWANQREPAQEVPALLAPHFRGLGERACRAMIRGSSALFAFVDPHPAPSPPAIPLGTDLVRFRSSHEFLVGVVVEEIPEVGEAQAGANRRYTVRYHDSTSEVLFVDVIRALRTNPRAMLKEASTETEEISGVKLGLRVRRKFEGHGFFNGTVTSFDTGLQLFQVRYDDGDEEDVAAEEAKAFGAEFAQWKQKEEQLQAHRSPPPKRRRRQEPPESEQEVPDPDLAEEEKTEPRTPAAGAKGRVQRGKDLVGRKVVKTFPGHGVFVGEVKNYRYGLYKVLYEDGDGEDLSYKELMEVLTGGAATNDAP